MVMIRAVLGVERREERVVRKDSRFQGVFGGLFRRIERDRDWNDAMEEVSHRLL